MNYTNKNKGGIFMNKFVLNLSDGRGHVYMLCADVEEEMEIIKKKISQNLVISGTYAHSCNGHNYPAKDPEILKQLKNFTGYDFVGFEPDLVLSYGGESFSLPGYTG